MKRNTHKYRCADCKAEQFMHKSVLNNRTRPRCTACGSLAIDPVTSLARNSIASGNDASAKIAEEVKKKQGWPQ